MILVVDNYDSFVHNLARYCRRLGSETIVCRNDELTVAEVEQLQPQAIVLSPGPGKPEQAGISVELVRRFHQQIPLLGVCLGHQAIAVALGALVHRAAESMHGRASEVWHDGSSLFTGVPSPFVAGRYHSLVVEEATLPSELEISARTQEGTIMAVEHKSLPVVGIQFHPESILTEHGFQVLFNFFVRAGIAKESPVEKLQVSERAVLSRPESTFPTQPVTF